MPYDVGKGGGPTPFANSFKGADQNSLRYNTSQYGNVVSVVYGCQRVQVNVIDMFGFSGSSGGGKKGGGKGGGKSSKKGGGNFSVNVDFELCQGPISFHGAPRAFGGPPTNNRVWANGGVAGVNSVPGNFYLGNDGQAPDPTFNGSGELYHPGYSGTAHVTFTPMQLGSTPALPNISFEITGFGVGTMSLGTFAGDALPSFVVQDLLTNARYGAGFPLANLDVSGSLTDYGTYCQAAGIGFSVHIDRQQPTARWLDQICQTTVAAPVFSGATLKIIPYYTSSITSYGSWTPTLTAQYGLTDNDLLDVGGGTWGGGDDKADPVVLTRTDQARVTNWFGINFEDVVYSYNQEVLPYFDQAAIDRYGIRQEPNSLAEFIANPTSALQSAMLQLRRKLDVRNTFKLKLGWRFHRLEPMDIVTFTDPILGTLSLRITQIDEDDNGDLSVTGEELPSVPTLPVVNRQTPLGNPMFDPFALPGNVNAPIIFEPPLGLTGGLNEIWVIATGASASWGGCVVEVSLDGSSYASVGTIFRGGRQGVLTATLASGSDPDTANVLSVDVSESSAQLLSGTQADADALITLCYVDGELLSYETATLTSAFHYNLTYLRRGAYGTAITSHASGSQFARVDPSAGLLKYKFPSNMVGKVIYFKFLSFNLVLQEAQTAADVVAYPFAILGDGTGGSPPSNSVIANLVNGVTPEDWGTIGTLVTATADFGTLGMAVGATADLGTV